MKKLILLLLLSAAPLYAVELLDQSCRPAADIRGYVFGARTPEGAYPWSPMAGQTVTAGENVNNISKVRILIWDATSYQGYDGNGYGATLAVWSDLNRTRFLGQSHAKDTEIPGWDAELCCSYVDFVFSPPIAVAPGSQYFLELKTAQDRPAYNVIVTWPSGYTRGHCWQAVPGPNADELSQYDLVFKVFADAGGTVPFLSVHGPADLGPEQVIPNHTDNAIAGQTFIATADVLRRIDVLGKDVGGGSQGITLHLYKGGPGQNEYLGSAFAPDSAISNYNWNYISFIFDHTIDVVAGHLYFMEFVSGGPHYRLGISSKDGGVENDYTGGRFWRNGQFWQIPSGMTHGDWIFETYTIAEPRFCEEVDSGYAAADFNRDCYVDWEDMIILAEEWLSAIIGL